MVISQEKEQLGATPPAHFGKLQRHLKLLEAESIQKESRNNSFNNSSKVIESYRPN